MSEREAVAVALRAALRDRLSAHHCRAEGIRLAAHEALHPDHLP